MLERFLQWLLGQQLAGALEVILLAALVLGASVNVTTYAIVTAVDRVTGHRLRRERRRQERADAVVSELLARDEEED